MTDCGSTDLLDHSNTFENGTHGRVFKSFSNSIFEGSQL